MTWYEIIIMLTIVVSIGILIGLLVPKHSTQKQEHKNKLKVLLFKRRLVEDKLFRIKELEELQMWVHKYPSLRKEAQDFLDYRNEMFGESYLLDQQLTLNEGDEEDGKI